jgi:hypothetical protein
MKRRHVTSKPPIITDVLLALAARPMFIVSTLNIVGLIAVARLVLGWAMESS